MTPPCDHCREKIEEKVTGALPPEDREALESHVRDCPDCRAYLEALQQDDRLLAAYGDAMKQRVARAERRIVEMTGTGVSELQGNLQAEPQGDAQGIEVPHRPFFRGEVLSSRWFRYAAAAVVLLGVLFVSQLWRSPQIVPVAWASVIAQVEQADDFICRWRMEMTSPRRITVEGVRYKSRLFGTRDDQFMNGELYMQTYYVPAELEQIGVDPRRKGYFRIRMDEDEFEYRAMQADAQEMVALFKEYPYRDLGQRRIDGVSAEGIELVDPEFMLGVFDSSRIRLWVDTATGWPVRLETEMSADGGSLQNEVVLYDFQWNVVLPAAEVDADIPADYELAMDIDAPVADEEHAIAGLRIHAERMDGRYPSSLTWGSAVNQMIMNPRSLGGDREEALRGLQELMRIRDTIAFYVELQKAGRDAAYHGNEVTASDLDRVLLRWRMDDGQYRVVYGDLSTQTVSPKPLAELEGAF
jgi:hypothetical protein